MKNQKIRYISLAITLVIVVVLISIFLIFNSSNNSKKNTSSGKKEITDNEEIKEIIDEKYREDELVKLVKILFKDVNDSNIKLFLEEIKKMDEIEITDAVDLVLPDCFDVLPNLTNLKINFSSLESLPKSFGKMKNLKKVYLSGNKLNESSLKQIFEIKSLEVLDISSNLLNNIPSEITNLTKLKELSFFGNNLDESSLKQIFEIGSLEILDISYNELNNIPNEITKLTKLKEVNLRGNKLNDLSLNHIFEIGSLETLNISSNGLNNVPSKIKNLINLKELNLYENKLGISSLKQIFEIKSLEILNISYNELTTIPSEITKLTKLKELDLSGNKLDADKTEESLEHIGNLGGSLEILNLSKTDITVLPKNLSNLKNLRELYLSYNENLREDDEEFKGIYKLKNLEILSINECKSLKPSIEEIRMKIRETLGLKFNSFSLIE